MNNPFDYAPDEACMEAFRQLEVRIGALRKSADPADIDFCRELDAGKMLGVLVADDPCGHRHTLYAFSGQIGARGFCYPEFVGPVFDYLQPDGYFKTHEADISRQSDRIAAFRKEVLSVARSEYEAEKARLDAEVADYREKCRLSKMERKERREAGVADRAELDAMIRRSQFEKAELHRLKKRAEAHILPYASRLRDALARLDEMKERRRADSESLQQWLFSNFKVLNARGESRSLSEIFADTPMRIPPSGAGECCAPKLLQAAFSRGWKPVSMAEYWYGRPRGGELRIHGSHYPACRGKCLSVLGWMLRGLDVEPPLDNDCDAGVALTPEIIYENRWFCVVVKPSGMLSVPGKGAAVSVEQWLAERYGADRMVKVAHRLDRDTSGLLLAAFGTESLKVMQSQFATRRVKKRYVAMLEGDYESLNVSRAGRIDLPLAPDWLDRPRQRVDPEGKEAATEYEFAGVCRGRSRIVFTPLTGRTHQLRVHAASEQGLGMPIAGDPLYGRNAGADARRLMLHACRLEFTFPVDGRHYRFESADPFERPEKHDQEP